MAEIRRDVVNSLAARLRQGAAPNPSIQPEAGVAVRPDVVNALTERLRVGGSMAPQPAAQPDPWEGLKQSLQGQGSQPDAPAPEVPAPTAAAVAPAAAVSRELPVTGPQGETGVRAGPLAWGAAQGVIEAATAPVALPQVAARLAAPEKGGTFEQVMQGIQDYTGLGVHELIYGPPVSEPAIQLARKALGGLGVEAADIDPQNRAERIAQRVVREVTGTAVSIPLIRQMSKGAQMLSPMRQTAYELAEGTASGVGAAVAGEIDPGNPLLEIAAQLTPTGAVLAGNLARNATGAMLGTGPVQKELKVAQALQNTIGSEIDNPSFLENIKRTTESQDIVEARTGRRPQVSLGETTRHPGLLALENTLQNSMPLRESGAIVDSRMKAIGLYNDALESFFPNPAPGGLKQAIYDRRTRIQRALEAKNAWAQGDLAKVQQLKDERDALVKARADQWFQNAETIRQKQADEFIKSSITEGSAARPRQQIARTMEASGQELRRQLRQAEIADGSRLRNQYIDILDNPQNKVAGTAGPVARDAIAMQEAAGMDMTAADLPRALGEFVESLRRRAANIKARSMGLPVPDKTQTGSVDFLTWVRKKGGIKLAAEDELVSEFNAVISPKETGTTGLLNNKQGLDINKLAQEAQEAGYTALPDKQDFLDTLRERVMSGRPLFPQGETDIFGDGIIPVDPAIAAAVSNEDILAVPITLKDLHTARSRALREQRALSPSLDAPKWSATDRFIRRIEHGMEEMAWDVGRQDVYDRLKSVNREFRHHAQLFRTGAGEKILRQKSGVPAMSVADVVKEFQKTPEAGQQFVDAIGNVGSARLALSTYLDHDLYLKAVDPKTGALKRDKVEEWMRQNDGVIRFMPELQEKYNRVFEVDDLAKEIETSARRITGKDMQAGAEEMPMLEAATQMAERQAARMQRANKLLEKYTRTFLGDDIGARADVRIKSLMKNDAGRIKLLQLARHLPGPNERQELGRLMYDGFMAEHAKGNPLLQNVVANPQGVRQFVRQNREVFTELYGEDHVANLQKVIDGLISVSAKEHVPRGTAIGANRYEQAGPKGAHKAILDAVAPAAFPLRTMKLRLFRYGIRAVANQFIKMNADDIQKITYEMMFDKDVAQTMAWIGEKKVAPRLLQARLKAHFTMLGAGSDDYDYDEQPEPATPQALP